MPAAPLDHRGQTGSASLRGRSVGKYRIEQPLGQGGMGVVYEARHHSIGQRAAVKVLHPHLSSDPRSLQRFFNEARAISSIHDAGMVKIFDHGQMSDGLAYIIMEFLEGESLAARLEHLQEAGERMPAEVALRLIGQVAATLKTAHQRGIVHRDLKPDNVFLIPDPVAQGGERTKLLDFGIAKFLTDAPGRKTTVGLVLGTPTYMAPEQCEGREDLTDKVDVYALGVMLYELLASEPPFQAETASTLLRQHMFRPPPPLPDLDRGVPREISSLVMDMLAKDPDKRPSVAQVLSRLEQIRSEKSRRFPARWLLLGPVLLLVLFGLFALLLRAHPGDPQARPGGPPPAPRPRPAAQTVPKGPAPPENPLKNMPRPPLSGETPVPKGPGHKHHGNRLLPTLNTPPAADDPVKPPVKPPAREHHSPAPGPRTPAGNRQADPRPDDDLILR